MPHFTPKERRAHYNQIGYGGAAVKADSRFTEEEQRAYARGQADARNEAAMAYMLGKNSPLSDAEKAQLKQENKELRRAMPERREEIKTARRARADKRAKAAKGGK